MASVAFPDAASFFPLVSSFACAIPGINGDAAAFPIQGPADHHIGVAPTDWTCSAPALPVYATSSGGVHSPTQIGHRHRAAGVLVLFGALVFGIVGAMVVALVLGRAVTKGPNSGFLMEMPKVSTLPRIGKMFADRPVARRA